MMTEHLTDQLVELYQRRQVEPAERQKSDAHLAVCKDCLNRVLDPEHAVLVLQSLSEAFLPSANEGPFHLSHEELKRYRAGAASNADQVICESHLEVCEQCNEELLQLSAVVHQPRATSAKVSTLTAQHGRPGRGWMSSTPARVAAAIAFVGLIVLAFLLWRQPSVRESARNQPLPVSTPSLTPAPASLPTPSSEIQPAAIALLKDNGKEIRLDHEGNLTGLEGLDEASQQMAKAALSGERLTKPKVLEGLTSPRIQLLGESRGEKTFRLLSPLGKVIIEDRPTLKWQPLAGAKGYVVSVFDGHFNRIAQSPPLTKTEWTLGVPLSRGGNFFWEVTATKEGKEVSAPAAPAPRAQFKVLDAENLSVLAKAKGQQPVSHLALGLMYARLGLLKDAEREFHQLVKDNPNSAEANKLLRTVQQWR
jgi:hypothetical protein